MGPETTIKIIEDYMNSEDKYMDFLSRDNIELVRKSVDLVKSHITTLNNGEEIEKFDEDIIKGPIHTVLRSLLRSPISDYTKTFIKSYSTLIYNWNKNILNDKKLEVVCEALDRIVNNHFTMVEAAASLRDIVSYFVDLRQWLPPAFDISKHYFKVSQKKRLEDIECKRNECETEKGV